MRVLFLTPSLGPGGAERLVIAYAHGLARRGMTVGIAFGDVASLQPLLRPQIQTFWLGDDALTPRTLHRWTPGIRDVVARFRPDVIYAHSVTAALAARLAARRLPLLVTVHGISPDDEAMAARLLRLSGARVTAVSLEAASGIGRHASAPPVEVIVPGVDTAALEEGAREPLEPLDPASPRFLCVARQHPAKGVDVLVRAFPRVLEQLPDARLLHIGAGSPDANRELAASLGVADRVTFAGLRLNVAPYLCAADVVVLPSRREGLPVAVLEALTLARPVVATAVGGTPTVIRPGETGWLVPPEDEVALADAMVDAGRRPEDGRRMAAAGREVVRGAFSVDASVARVEALLREVVGGHDSRLTLRPLPYYRGVRAFQRARGLRANGAGAGWRGVRVFAYHRIFEDPRDVLAVSPRVFARHMEILAASDVEPVSVDRALDLLDEGADGRYACVTFDDAYRDNLDHAAPVLERLGIPASIYVPTWIVSGQASYHWYRQPPPPLSWDELRDLDAGGLIDVHAHTRTHPRLPAVSARQARNEILGSKVDLEERLGRPVSTFSYPAGLFGPREARLVREAGFRAALSTDPGVNTAGTPRDALRRTMIFWRDGEDDFTRKLHGGLDAPARLRTFIHQRRARA